VAVDSPSAIRDIPCQVTRGAVPRFSADQRAQWIKRRLDALGWQKKTLAEQLQAASDGRLGPAGAAQLVRRATSGSTIRPENQALLVSVLGRDPADTARELEVLVVEAERLARELLQLASEARANGATG
jgi:hypothetical protein